MKVALRVSHWDSPRRVPLGQCFSGKEIGQMGQKGQRGQMGRTSKKGQSGQAKFGSSSGRELITSLANFYPNTSPGDFVFPEWEWIREKGIQFLEEFADRAFELGWSAQDLVYLDEQEPDRLRQTRGLAWIIGDGYQIISLDKDGADIRAPSGETIRWYAGRGAEPKF